MLSLVAEREKVIRQRHQLEIILDDWNLQEREVASDCRYLAEELSEIRLCIEQLEAQADKRIKNRTDTDRSE